MNGRVPSLLVLCVALSLGCSKNDDAAKGEAKPADAKAGAAKGGAEGGETKTGEAKTNAAGGAVAEGGTVTDCPPSLAGAETVSRVITKDCGVVPVTADYSIDGATLTLEAGATLAFAEGAELSVGYYEAAKLVVKGTAEAPVTFTTSADKVPGVWKGVRLHAKDRKSTRLNSS